MMILKFVYSEKASKFCEIFPLLLSTVQTNKSKRKISQNFVTFSGYMNFKDSTVFWLTEEWKSVSDLKNHATDENHGKVGKMLGETLRAPPHVGLYKNNN